MGILSFRLAFDVVRFVCINAIGVLCKVTRVFCDAIGILSFYLLIIGYRSSQFTILTIIEETLDFLL